MKIYMLRHGETDSNVLGLLQGGSDMPLNENGIRLAELCGEGMRHIRFDRCTKCHVSGCLLYISFAVRVQSDLPCRLRWIVGKTRASPVDKRTAGMPSRLSPPVGILNEKARRKSSVQQLTSGQHLFPRKILTLFICRYSRKTGLYS